MLAPPRMPTVRRTRMGIYIKLAPRDYDRLRSLISTESAARQAIDQATRVDHALEGVLFEGYTVPCSEEQGRAIRAVARDSCPELLPTIDQAIHLARPG